MSHDPYGLLLSRMLADIDALKRDVAALRVETGMITTWGKRGGLLVLLWAGAIGLNLTTEQKAEALAMVLKSLAR